MLPKKERTTSGALVAALAAMTATGNTPTRILAYGDSLTQGCTSVDNGISKRSELPPFYPYAETLQHLFDQEQPGRVTIRSLGHIAWRASDMPGDLSRALIETWNGMKPDVVLTVGRRREYIP